MRSFPLVLCSVTRPLNKSEAGVDHCFSHEDRNSLALCSDKMETSTPFPRANPGHLTILCARGVGNLTFACVGWGKLNQKNQVSNDFFFEHRSH